MKLKNQRVLICGAGGFIGGHLVKYLLNEGVRELRAVDLKPLDEWHQSSPAVENLVCSLSELDACQRVTRGFDVVFQLAADMGGMGFIQNNKALCMLSVLVNTHMLMAAETAGSSVSSIPRLHVSTARRNKRMRTSLR